MCCHGKSQWQCNFHQPIFRIFKHQLEDYFSSSQQRPRGFYHVLCLLRKWIIEDIKFHCHRRCWCSANLIPQQSSTMRSGAKPRFFASSSVAAFTTWSSSHPRRGGWMWSTLTHVLHSAFFHFEALLRILLRVRQAQGLPKYGERVRLLNDEKHTTAWQRIVAQHGPDWVQL